MSELREELLGSAINKKRIIGVALVAIILISLFGFSVVLTSFIFGSQRPFPSEEKANTEYEDAELVVPPLPLDFLAELLQYLSLEQLAELAESIDPQDLADLIENMMDGDVDDLDLSQFSDALLPLLFGAAGLIEKFRIYDYNSVNDIADALWRYECFDEYTGDQWVSTANALLFDFISLGEYWSQYSSQDVVKIKMPLSTSVGQNTMGLPILFPTPFILEDSFVAPYLVPDSETLTKDDFNSTSVNLDFSIADSINMSFELFGSDLPSEQDINNSAVLVSAPPSTEYTNILNQYIQFPPDFNSYYTSQLNFQTHYDTLDLIIDNSNDNAFAIAIKIRNYLQSQFTFPESPDDYQSAPEGRDTVDWFLEQGKGVFSDFVSAFCVFSRAFGVASRFVDGFKTPNFFGQIEEIWDQSEGKDAIIIRYNNIFNWAEIYVPTEIDGDGMWTQFDVTSGGGGIVIPSTFNITVNSNFTAGIRGPVANLTAILTSSTNQSVGSREITFIDTTYGAVLGNATTNLNGTASILVNINSSQVVGPHIIVAQYGSAINWTMYTVYGDIEVNLTSVNPTMINRSISNTTRIQGFVNDPIANQRVKNATVEFVLLDEGTNNKIGFPFDTNYVNADENGDFDEFVKVNSWVPKGNYEIRVDFNGSWNGIPLAFGIMNDSSNRIDFNVTEETTYNLLFYINDFEAYNYESPTVTRYSTLKLKAILLNETGDPVEGEVVDFYDYSCNDFLIGSNITNINGITTFNYNVNNCIAGPNLLYSQYETFRNYSYFILDAPISINLNIWPEPHEINKTSPYNIFQIQGNINDTFNSKQIKYGQISIHMFDGPIEVYNLVLESGSLQSNEHGEIYAEFSVDSLTVAKNYTLQVWFNGTFNYPLPIPHFFNLFAYSNFSSYANADYELTVWDPSDVIIIFKIEGNHRSLFYNDGNPPATYNPGQIANFEVWINQGGLPAPSGSIVRLRDVYTNDILNSSEYDGTEGGYKQFIIEINSTAHHAGLHYIVVEYVDGPEIYPYNSTYIIINKTLTVDSILNDYVILRDVDAFTISGTISDLGEDLKGLEVEVILLDSNLNDVSYHLNLFDPKTQFINEDGTYSFSGEILLTCPQGEYNFVINFTGRIQHTDGSLFITLSNPFMISSNSSLMTIDITAVTQIDNLAYSLEYDIFPDKWVDGDTLYVVGNLTWDNNTGISWVIINVTIIDERDGTIVIYNYTILTDLFGGFNVSIYIDENDSWPTLKSDTEIIVSFDPIINGIDYVEPDEESIFPP
ncbi:MAG: hypothetical protein KGD65_01635 [Candidatus Lokiarchaeota archaeon]|nr:hypothetical protein [Candidatus Lokiarchaeota archaeon]